MIPRLDRKTRFYAENLGELIRIEIKYSIKNVANIFEKNDIDFTTSMKGHSPSQALIYRYYSIFLNVLGDYENAGKLALKAKGIIAEDSGVKNSYYIYYLTALAYTKLEQGSSVGAIPIIEQSIIPFTRLHDTKDFLGFYQTEFCYRLALLENTKRLKELCFDGFKNTTDILGKGNYWSNYAASGVIAWYTMNPSDEKEKQYITLLESDFEELHNKEKVRRGFILERYFISRKNIEKSSHYQDIVEQAMDDYYGSVDAINRYYHQIMAAELALLNKDSATAKQHLSEVKVKLCGLGEQNPHRIKYIKLTKSLSMSTCGAI